MIIKSPYAFLVKNFRKVHIVLLLLSIYIYIKTLSVYSFVNEFMKLRTYDAYSEPVSGYVSFLLFFSIIIVILLNVFLLLLLKKKGKPWKSYLVPIADYIMLFIGFILVYTFFKNYHGQFNLILVRAMRDTMFVGTFPQYLIFVIYAIRIIGLDVNKFEFNLDEEYLQLDDKDKQEYEFSINIDKHSFIRLYRRALRNIGYFYKEHKKTIRAIGIIILVVLVFKSSKLIFVNHKVYKQGEVFQVNGYSVKVNNSYFTNKDYSGKIVEKGYNFVILDITIVNNYNKRKIDFNRFHVMNGVSNYSPTAKTYGELFNDLGVAYDYKTIGKNESFDTLLIFKVDKKLSKNGFVLYYQEFFSRTESYLRKIKLKITDLSKIKDVSKVKLGKEFNIVIDGEEENIIFDKFEVLDSVNYKYSRCNYSGCDVRESNFKSKYGNKILKLDFESNGIDGKDMIDFLSKYGTINYIDSKDEEKSIKISNAIDRTHLGKYVYILLPRDIQEIKKCEMIITVRNNRYTVKIK